MSRWRNLLLGLTAVVGLSGALAVASYNAHGALFRLAHPPNDIAVNGRLLVDGRELKPSDHAQLNIALPDVLLSTGTGFIPVEAAAIGLRIEPSATQERIARTSTSTTLWQRLWRAFRPTPSIMNIEAVLSLSETDARRTLLKLADSLREEPVNASLQVERYQRVAAVFGRELDVETSIDRLRDLESGGQVAELEFRRLAPKIRDEDLPQVDVSQVLAQFETDFRKKAGRRALNIRRAAALIDGYILGPGEVFSFNKVVGNRSRRNGFITAPVIVNDELEPGLGGGVCQAATTVYAAAVHGELETIRRRSHSRPSGYAPLGLDAAVVYGKVDLRLKNPYPVPLMVRAYFPSKYVLRVEWLGKSPPGDVRHQYAVLAKHEFYRRIVEAPELSEGEFERTQEGGYGYDVVSTVSTTAGDGSRRKIHYRSKYYPVPEVYRVGPNTSLELLPELPEGAVSIDATSLAEHTQPAEEEPEEVTIETL